MTGDGALTSVTLAAPAGVLPELAAFYGTTLGLRTTGGSGAELAVELGESTLRFVAAPGQPFYHVALLAPGNRFAHALAWARGRVVLLPDEESGEESFDFASWEADACYFHDPAGNIVELIAHRGISEVDAPHAEPFTGRELVGISEIGIVCDPPTDADGLVEELAARLGLALWDGSIGGAGWLGFVGERARTLILCPAGRPWLPTGRPAEPHPVELEVAGGPPGVVPLPAGGIVRRP